MRLTLIIVGIIFSGAVFAETVFIEASQDNTLYESPQGSVSNGAGIYLFAGRTNGAELRRGVVAFKDLSAIPAGATIQSVKLHLYMSKTSSAGTPVRLVRLLSDWGEGTSDATQQEGQGAPAQTGDATWVHTHFNNAAWSTPGGDFAGDESAQVNVSGVGSYTFESTAATVSDVQNWLDNPGENFGWILIADESARSSKRFNSREHGTEERRPMIEVEFTGGSPPDWSGPWFDPALDGEGYLVFKTPVGWLIYYFGYSAEGDRLWLVSEIVDIGVPDFDTEYQFSMLVGTPGSFAVPTPSADLEFWGTLGIQLSDCFNGVFTLDGTDGMKVSNVQKIVGIEGTSCTVE